MHLQQLHTLWNASPLKYFKEKWIWRSRKCQKAVYYTYLRSCQSTLSYLKLLEILTMKNFLNLIWNSPNYFIWIPATDMCPPALPRPISIFCVCV